MRPAAASLLAGAVVALALLGLAAGALRPGPFDVRLEPAAVEATAQGTYRSQEDSSVLGVCPVPPCAARTEADLLFQGLPLPAGSYVAWLEGGGSREFLGPLQEAPGGHRLLWSREGASDATAIALDLAGRTVAMVAVRPGGPWDVAATLGAAWPVPAAEARVEEIGGVTVSTVATARLRDAAPDGWELHAVLHRTDGSTVGLGALERDGDGSVLDGRVERVRLSAVDRLSVVLVPAGVPSDEGFQVLSGPLWAA